MYQNLSKFNTGDIVQFKDENAFKNSFSDANSIVDIYNLTYKSKFKINLISSSIVNIYLNKNDNFTWWANKSAIIKVPDLPIKVVRKKTYG